MTTSQIKKAIKIALQEEGLKITPKLLADAWTNFMEDSGDVEVDIEDCLNITLGREPN